MSEEVLDLPEFKERVQDDNELILELFEIFVEDFKDKRVKLDAAASSGDCEVVGSIGHSLKGASGNISAKALRVTCMALEEMGKAGDLAELENRLNELDEKFEQLCLRIESIKKELS